MTSEVNRTSRHAAALKLTTLVGVGLALVVGWIVFDPMARLDDDVPEVATTRATSELAVVDVSESFDAEGTLSFANTSIVRHPGDGVVTQLASPSNPVATGTQLYAVNDVPAIAVEGAVPAWRTMAIDATGPDVEQLERGLVELGYDELGLLSVDDTYTSYTADLVSLWQADLGVAETGVVEFGTVVFVTSDLMVGSVFAEVGQAPPADGMMSLRSNEREVVFVTDSLPTLVVGDTLSARLPDRSEFEVTVVGVAPGADSTWTVTGWTDITAVASDLADEVPIELSWSIGLGEDVLVTPASTLKRLDSGDYVLEVVLESTDEALITEFVVVELGVQSGNLIEVTGDVTVGTAVVDP